MNPKKIVKTAKKLADVKIPSPKEQLYFTTVTKNSKDFRQTTSDKPLKFKCDCGCNFTTNRYRTSFCNKYAICPQCHDRVSY